MRENELNMRRGTAAQWRGVNPILATGEPGFESDTKKLKFGDGTTAWNNLPYFHVDGGELSFNNCSSSSSSSSSGTISCPAPWMNILLSDGSFVPAGELKVGMSVRTNHEETMEMGSYDVTHVSTVEAERIQFKIGDLDFVCSKSHKFYMEGSWKEAESLRVGDLIGGKRVNSIENIGFGEVVKITVDSAHTYVCEGLLSHNKTPGTSSSSSSSGRNSCDEWEIASCQNMGGSAFWDDQIKACGCRQYPQLLPRPNSDQVVTW